MEDMDRLDVIFALQKSLDEDIMKRRDLHYSYEEWMQKDALACIEEIMEVLNEVQYKWWKNKKPQDHTGATPTRQSSGCTEYTFSGWSPTIVTATGNATYTATFEETTSEYTITVETNDSTKGSVSIEF